MYCGSRPVFTYLSCMYHNILLLLSYSISMWSLRRYIAFNQVLATNGDRAISAPPLCVRYHTALELVLRTDPYSFFFIFSLFAVVPDHLT